MMAHLKAINGYAPTISQNNGLLWLLKILKQPPMTNLKINGVPTPYWCVVVDRYIVKNINY